MTRKVDATRISDGTLAERRTVTATGTIHGTYKVRDGTVVAICVPPGETVDIHPA